MEKKYIIKAEYGALPYYIGKDKNNNVFMEKLRAWNIYDDDFGYTLDEAKQIMKMYKSYEKKKYKEWQEYLNEFRKHGLVAPTWTKPYIAKKYYLARKSKLKNNIELKRTPTGKYQYYWKSN
jgi:hypothetical protein